MFVAFGFGGWWVVVGWLGLLLVCCFGWLTCGCGWFVFLRFLIWLLRGGKVLFGGLGLVWFVGCFVCWGCCFVLGVMLLCGVYVCVGWWFLFVVV